MHNQTSVLELEKTTKTSNSNRVNIDQCIENLKNTIQKLENAINSIDETWLFGRLTDDKIKRLKKTLLRQIKKLIPSTKKDENTLSNIASKLDCVIDMVNYYSTSEKKFMGLSDYRFDLIHYKTSIESYVNSLKKQLADKHLELAIANKTLLDSLDKNPSKQEAIKSLITTAQIIQNNNIQLTKNIDVLKNTLNNTIKENEELKAELTQKRSELNITKQERDDFKKENQQLKQNEMLHKEKERQLDSKIEKKLLENTKLISENNRLKQGEIIKKKEIIEQRSVHNDLKYKYQNLKTNFADLSNKFIGISNISDKKTERYLKENNKLKQRIRELEQEKSNTNRSNQRDAHSSYNPNQLFSSVKNNIDYKNIGTANNMQKTLYGRNNY